MDVKTSLTFFAQTGSAANDDGMTIHKGLGIKSIKSQRKKEIGPLGELEKNYTVMDFSVVTEPAKWWKWLSEKVYL